VTKGELLRAQGPGDTALRPVQAATPVPPRLPVSSAGGDGEDPSRSKERTTPVAGSLAPPPAA